MEPSLYAGSGLGVTEFSPKSANGFKLWGRKSESTKSGCFKADKGGSAYGIRTRDLILERDAS